MKTAITLGLIKKSWIVSFALLLIIFASIFFYHLGSRPLLDYDEGIYAQVAKQAMQIRQPLNFQWLGNVGLGRNSLWFEKPPAMVLLTEFSFKVFGFNEMAARFWVPVFALATIVLTGLASYRFFQSKLVAILSIASYFVAFQYIYNVAILQFDITVGFFILLSLYAFYEAGELKKQNFWYVFFLAISLGILTKSVIGLLPIPIIAIYCLVKAEANFLKNKTFWLSALMCMSIIAPWHIYESIKYGHLFWDQYLFYHVLERFTLPLEGNQGSFSFYCPLWVNTPQLCCGV